MSQREVIHITNGGGWHLVHDGRKIGPYSSEDEAVAVARRWADLARRQGYVVEVIVDAGDHLPLSHDGLRAEQLTVKKDPGRCRG